MALYQLTLFYPNLKSHADTVRRIRAEVDAIAGKNWRVLSAGEQVCAIGFATDVRPELLGTRFRAFQDEHFEFLLTEVAAIHAGYLSEDTLQWLASRLPSKR